MRISNWSILFIMLFLCMVLRTDLRYHYDREAQFTMELYNRIFDRAAEDALADQLREEYADGSLEIAEEKVHQHFVEQIAFMFDQTSQDQKEKLQEMVLLKELVNKGNGLIAEEQTIIRECMEKTIREKSAMAYMTYALLLPTEEGTEWTQNIKDHGFYSFLELPDQRNYRWTYLFDEEKMRYALSGAQMKKKLTAE